MSVYPPEISERAASPQNTGRAADENAAGRAASFVCGVNIRFSLRISGGGEIESARFTTNGCGYMVAAADMLSDWITGRRLKDLHGLETARETVITKSVAVISDARLHCPEIAFDALKAALAEYRRRVVGEFTGETPLICSCFGVSEETILELISSNRVENVAGVGEICNAGSGCGACRMLIQELIDLAHKGA